MLVVILTPQEVARAAAVGRERHNEAVRRGYADRHGFVGDGEAIHINGACGELAFAKAMGVEWLGLVNTFKSQADVLHYQIRTRSQHWYDLLHRDDDKPEEIYVHVTGLAPEFVIRGWIKGADARRPEWRQGHGGREPAWFVPEADLHSIELLLGYTPKLAPRRVVPEAPDLQEWVRKYGGYLNIPWDAWHAAMRRWRVLMGQL